MANSTVYLGTYSSEVYVYRLDATSGLLTFVGSAAEIVKPSYLSISADCRFLYAVNEVREFNGLPGGGLTAFAIDPESGLLNRLNAQSSGGAAPCYVSTYTGLAFVANYGGGSLAVLPIDVDGTLGPPIQIIQHHGASLHNSRQNAPHVHSVVVDMEARYVLAADLGIDKLVVYRLDSSNRTMPLTKAHEVSVEASSGPRHLSFDPTGHYLYLANELSSTLTAFAYDPTNGTLQALQTISALPQGFSDANQLADIHVNAAGTHLYVSNRGHDSIASFAVDVATGRLTLMGFVATLGHTPRNFALDPSGKWLIVANQDSNNLVVFNVDQTDSPLAPTGQIVSVPKPACVKIVSP